MPIQNLCQYFKSSPKVQDQKNDHDHLGCSFKFAPVVCSDDNAVFGSDQSEATDNKFSCNDNDHEPCRQAVKLDHADQCRTNKKLVSKRIHEFTKIGNQIILAGKMTVKPVRNTCHYKNSKADIAVGISAPASQNK